MRLIPRALKRIRGMVTEKQVRELAANLGIPLADGRTGDWWNWVLHEICHYQVASAERRLLPDFGLGLSSTSGHEAFSKEQRKAFRVMPKEASDIEEGRAC